MNNKFKNMFLTSLICSMIFSSCALDFWNNGKDDDEEQKIPGTYEEWGLSAEVELKIKQDYLDIYIKPEFSEATIEDVWIEKFYGVYGRDTTWEIRTDDIVAVMMNSRYDDWGPNEEQYVLIDRILFRYNNKNRILIWNKGRFHDMEKFYASPGRANVLMIANYHLGLCMKVDRKIKEEGRNFLNTPFSDLLKDPDWPYFEYYGTYNGHVAIFFTETLSGGLEASAHCIAGVIFGFPSGTPIISIYKEEDTSIWNLDNAYLQDWLTKEDIMNISYFRNYFHTITGVVDWITFIENAVNVTSGNQFPFKVKGDLYRYNIKTEEKLLVTENYLGNFKIFVEEKR